MPDTKVSALTDGTTANTTDRLPAARSTDGGVTWSNVYVTPGYIKTFLGLNVASTKTLTANNTLTLAGTDSTTMTFPATSATIARTDAGQTFTGNQVITGAVGGSGLTVTGATQTTSQPVLNLSQTWNGTSSTLFYGAIIDISTTVNTTSSFSSPLFAVRINGLNALHVGSTSGANGGYAHLDLRVNSANPDYSQCTLADNGVLTGIGAGRTTVRFDASTLVHTSPTNFRLGASTALGWSTSPSDTASRLLLTNPAAATLQLGAADAGSVTQTVTITIASPGVVTWSNHGFSTGTPVFFTTTGALPTGITAGTTYYVIFVTSNTFQIATSYANALAGTAVNTSGSQSGTHTGNRNAIAQALRVQSVTGVTDRPGAGFVIQGSAGTGTGAGGSIIFQVAPAGSSGTAQNAYSTALTIDSDARNITIAPTRTDYGTIACGTDGYKSIVLCGSSDNGIAAVRNTGSVEGFVVRNSSAIGWLNSSNVGSASIDNNSVLLYRDAANTLALRNGTNAQKFRIYETTDGTNSAYLELQSSGGVFYLNPNKTGTGSVRNLWIGTVGTGASLTFFTNSDQRWRINDSGHFLAATDNVYDIGATSSGRPKNIYVGSGLTTGGGAVVGTDINVAATRAFYWTSGAILFSTGAGILAFEGRTSSFPALKRSSTTLQVRLADDSAFAPLSASNLTASGNITANGATSVVGYATGAGGAVTQATSRTTGVTLDKGCGQITLVSAAGTTSWQSFTVTNSTVAATDTIIVNQDTGTDLYQIFVTNVAAGSFQITFATTGGATTEQPVFSFAVIKAVAA